MVFIGHKEGNLRVGYWVDKVRWEGLRDCGLGENWEDNVTFWMAKGVYRVIKIIIL